MLTIMTFYYTKGIYALSIVFEAQFPPDFVFGMYLPDSCQKSFCIISKNMV